MLRKLDGAGRLLLVVEVDLEAPEGAVPNSATTLKSKATWKEWQMKRQQLRSFIQPSKTLGFTILSFTVTINDQILIASSLLIVYCSPLIGIDANDHFSFFHSETNNCLTG